MPIRMKDLIGIVPLRSDVQSVIDISNIRTARFGTCIIMIFQIFSLIFSLFFQVQDGGSLLIWRRVAYIITFLASLQFFIFSLFQKPVSGGFSRVGLGISMSIFHFCLCSLGIFISLLDYLDHEQIFVFITFQMFIVGLFILKPYIAFIIFSLSFGILYFLMQKYSQVSLTTNMGFVVLYVFLLMTDGIQYWRYLRIARYNVQNHIMAEQMKIMSLYDPLTKLKNRLALKEDFEKSLDSMIVLMICDIDDFKIHNDTYGHEHGDDVLESFARNLIKVFGTDHCYRYGGDEFLVMLSGENLETFVAKFEECRQNVGDAYHFSGGYVQGYPKIPEDFQRLMNQADHNLYKAKQNGKNQIIG
ncbi:MAG: GGDEF domain-containing protein [Treponema sp.]|nr:GGDEF domain-containing protein [Treponema sp.]